MKPLNPESVNDLQQAVNSYEPPQIEILGITVEKGFALSGDTFDLSEGNW